MSKITSPGQDIKRYSSSSVPCIGYDSITEKLFRTPDPKNKYFYRFFCRLIKKNIIKHSKITI